MTFKAARLSCGRWGIFNGDRLLATVGSQQAINLMNVRLAVELIELEDQQSENGE